jgi:hypothetical protein
MIGFVFLGLIFLYGLAITFVNRWSGTCVWCGTQPSTFGDFCEECRPRQDSDLDFPG